MSPAIEIVKLRARVKALTHALQNLLTETIGDLVGEALGLRAEVERLTAERDRLVSRWSKVKAQVQSAERYHWGESSLRADDEPHWDAFDRVLLWMDAEERECEEKFGDA